MTGCYSNAAKVPENAGFSKTLLFGRRFAVQRSAH